MVKTEQTQVITVKLALLAANNAKVSVFFITYY